MSCGPNVIRASHRTATVWDWNIASRRVLAKLGFTETDRTEVDEVRGTTLFTTRPL
ncbi:MAG: hypothetical protein ABIS91_11335 [Nocardioides sp.]